MKKSPVRHGQGLVLTQPMGFPEDVAVDYLRPFLASIRMRNALSLIKPAASAWL